MGSESSASRGEGSLGRAAAGCMAAGGEPILVGLLDLDL